MCDFCKNEHTKHLDYVIKAANETINICPNCVALYNSNKRLKIPKGTNISEISGEKEAVEILNNLSSSEKWFVTPDETLRLLGHSLMPNEVKALLKNHKITTFELHDDFYDPDDYLAVQPDDERTYIKDLKRYVKSSGLSYKEKVHINKYIKWLKGENDG